MYLTSSISKWLRSKTQADQNIQTLHRTKTVLIGLIGALLLLSIVILATAVGAVSIPYSTTALVLLDQLPFVHIADLPEHFQTIIIEVRLPRIIVAILVGAALGVSGAVMQGLFRNPMADPGIIGVSSGAALGAVFSIYMGLSTIHYLFTPSLAFLGAIVTVTVVYLMAQKQGRMAMATLLLSGIAISSFLGAITSFILSISNENVMREIVFWMMGGLAGRSWTHVSMVLLPVLLGIFVLGCYARSLNIMLLGEESAGTLGVNVQRTRRILLAIASLVTGVSVSVSGIIAFVGLVIPHMVRLIVGPDHRHTIVASAFGGAIFLVAADLVSRMVLRPAELQVGIVTAFIGAPFFLYLLRKNKKADFL